MTEWELFLADPHTPVIVLIFGLGVICLVGLIRELRGRERK